MTNHTKISNCLILLQNQVLKLMRDLDFWPKLRIRINKRLLDGFSEFRKFIAKFVKNSGQSKNSGLVTTDFSISKVNFQYKKMTSFYIETCFINQSSDLSVYFWSQQNSKNEASIQSYINLVFWNFKKSLNRKMIKIFDLAATLIFTHI